MSGNSRQEQIGAAIAAGEKALRTAERVVEDLRFAKDHGYSHLWGAFIPFMPLTNFFHLLYARGFRKDAERELETLRRELAAFDASLADGGLAAVDIRADIACKVKGVQNYTGFLLGPLGDLGSHERVVLAWEETKAARDQIRAALTRLEAMAGETG